MVNSVLIGTILLHGTWKKSLRRNLCRRWKEGIKIAVRSSRFSRNASCDSIFRASGALGFRRINKACFRVFGIPPEIVPLAILRPISGNAALGVTSDLIATYGPDSFIGRLASVMQGSTDTTFYILTVYFGAVGIKKWGCVKDHLIADAIGIGASIVIVTLILESIKLCLL